MHNLEAEKGGAICDEIVESWAELQKQRLSLVAWHEAVLDFVDEINKGWFASCKDACLMARCLEASTLAVANTCVDHLRQVCENLQSKVPPFVLVSDAKMLTDTGLRDTFCEIVSKEHLGSVVGMLGGQLLAFRHAEQLGLGLAKQTEASRLYQHCKRCVGAAWLVRQVTDAQQIQEQSAKPGGLKKWAEGLVATLERKGIGAPPKIPLPEFLQQLLCQMHTAKPEDAKTEGPEMQAAKPEEAKTEGYQKQAAKTEEANTKGQQRAQ